MKDKLVGTVEHVVYSDAESGFTVAHLKSRDVGKTCIVGTFPALHAGEVVDCEGQWQHHPTFGRQFSVEQYVLKTPNDVIGIQKFLESGLIKGIGPVFAERIVLCFGEKTLDVIDKHPERLLEVEGLGKKKLDKIISCWGDQKAVRAVMVFLRGHGISLSLAQKIYRRYGDAAIEVIRKNPYTISRDLFGVGFKTADKIAMSLGIAPDAPERVQAGIEYTLLELSDEGHVCYPKEDLAEQVGKRIDVSLELVQTCMERLLEEKRLMQHALEGRLFIWLKNNFFTEIGTAKELKRLLEGPCALRTVDKEKAIDWSEKKLDIQFAEEQRDAIDLSVSQKLHIITGGPGTGKSTITQAIIRITEKITDEIILAAPTGKAAKRMSQITGKRASTIHSMLEFDFTTGRFKRDGENQIECDLLIVDEASMIDSSLIYCLLQAIPSSARVIFIGDIDQLPSVGSGNVLKDLIASGVVPTTRLTQIFRQAYGSRIVTNAHLINKGEMPDLSVQKESDFVFISREKPEDIMRTLMELITTRLPKRFKHNPLSAIQVLAPMKRGVVGIDNLNHVMQATLNPTSVFIERMGRKFSPGDKVMQIRNNTKKHVFNGDVGFVRNFSKEDETMWVDFDGREISYEFSELDELILAYAVSIHKYQGSECPCIVIPIHTTHFKLLYRNLLYTGITRGKSLVVLIGSKRAVAIATGNDDVRQRYTGLRNFVQSA